MVSMRDVARAAGVSKATVSKVLSGKGSTLRISLATQSHVRAVANQLGYVPGPLIRYRPAEIKDSPQTSGDSPVAPSPVSPVMEAEEVPQDPAPEQSESGQSNVNLSDRLISMPV